MLDALTLPAMPRKPMAISEKRTELAAARITKSLMQRLTAIATADDRTISYVVEKAIELFVDQHEKPHKPPKR